MGSAAPGRAGRGAAGRTPPLPRAVARDARLSRGERGLLAELWSRGPGWLFSVKGLYKATRLSPAVEGREALYRMVRHLGRAGYLETVIIGVPPGTGPGEVGPSGRAWDSRYRLVYSAAPSDDAGFVHVPWALARDRQLSYRDRGLLIERLSYGTTVHGTTVAVHDGGADTLGGPHHGDGVKAVRPALARLAARGYVLATRGRDEAGRMTRARILFRSAPLPPAAQPAPGAAPDAAPDASPAPAASTSGAVLSTASRPASRHRPLPAVPVDNQPLDASAATSDDPASPQVTATSPFPGAGAREACPTCGNVASAQVTATPPFPGAVGEPSKGSLEGEGRSSVLSVRTVQVGDAREPNPLRGNEDHAHSVALARRLQQLLHTGMTPDSIAATAAQLAAEHPALRGRRGGREQAELLRALAAQLAAARPPDGAAAAPPVAGGAHVHRRSTRRPPIPRTGWDTLAQLPRPFRDGAPGWVRRELARRLARWVEDEGLTAAAIVATAQRLAPERIITRDHVDALAAVRTRLRVDLAAGDVCGTCGGQRWTAHGRCPRCDDHRPLDAAERAQLAAAWTHLTGRPGPSAAPAADAPAPDAWRPP